MKTDKTNIFEFNHIDKSLSETEVGCLKDFYKHYHKKYWCFKKSYKRYKKLDEPLAITGGELIVIWHYSGGNNTKSNNPRYYQWRWRYCGKYCKNEELQKKY